MNLDTKVIFAGIISSFSWTNSSSPMNTSSASPIHNKYYFSFLEMDQTGGKSVLYFHVYLFEKHIPAIEPSNHNV